MKLLWRFDWIRIRQLVWLKRHGLEYGFADYLAPETGNHHTISDPVYLKKVLRGISIPKESVCLDLGAGMGIATIVLSRYFKTVVGVELAEDLVETARKNLERMKVRNVELVCGDARDYTDLDRISYVYMFNPFPAKVMEEVMKNIKRSLVRVPRRVTIIYNCPVCRKVVEEGGFEVERVFKFKRAHWVGVFLSTKDFLSTNDTNATQMDTNRVGR